MKPASLLAFSVSVLCLSIALPRLFVEASPDEDDKEKKTQDAEAASTAKVAAIDISAVFGTLFGLATSLGAGATSVSTGFNRLFGTPDTTTTQIIIIGVITLAATVSLVTGVDKGIKRLSEANMVFATLLLLFVFI